LARNAFGKREKFKPHTSVIPLAALCLAGERRTGDSPRVQHFYQVQLGSPLSPGRAEWKSGDERTEIFCRGETGERIMPSYGPELIQIMRAVLDEVMTKIPVEQVTPGIKAHMAEFILKAAAEGQTSYDGLLASASDQIQTIVSMLT
jgi:hypothetical protein